MRITLCYFWINRIDKDQPHGSASPPFHICRSILALKLEPILRKKAKERMLAGKKIDPVQISAQGVENGKTRDELSKIAGVSHDTIDKTKTTGRHKIE